jgi:3-oxoacyl-[acyl-carrier protein] reductase
VTDQVLWGRAALITGASRGLGLEIALEYARAGADLFLCARDESVLAEARARVQAETRSGQVVAAAAADVAQPQEVERLVGRALATLGGLQILVNNAGIYGPKGVIEECDWEEWAHAIQVNLCGSVLCARAVVPHFRQDGYGKIVQLSGGGATAPLPRLSAYAASKAGVVRFAETLAEELRGSGVDVNCIAPGMLNTRLLDEVLAVGPERVGRPFYEKALQQKQSGGTPLDAGARLAVFLASAASDGITGKLISAVWDPWEGLPKHRTDLAGDVYTLRRIVPADRGMDWGKR